MGIRRIAINTGGGDAPGLNAVIRAVVLSARERGWEVLGIRRGYEGFLDHDKILRLDREAVRGIGHRGGTMLGTVNSGSPFEMPVRGANGETVLVDRSDEIVESFHRLGLDALVAVGGDGSMRIANRFAEKGIPIVGVPKTIDNDLAGTVFTFGFHTAVEVATEAVDRLHTTAESHDRVFVIEVMGRYAGWIAIYAGLAGGADVILIPEIPYSIDAVCEKIMERERRGRLFSLCVVAEGATPVGGEMVFQQNRVGGGQDRLGGVGDIVARQIAERTGKQTRSVVLGHLQRGGNPSPTDRILGLRFGAAAVRMIEEKNFNVMVALDPPDVRTVPLTEAVQRLKAVPVDGDAVQSGRDCGISFGEELPDD